jgi:hypothetical protein
VASKGQHSLHRMNTGSTFFTNFFLRDLVKFEQPAPTSSARGVPGGSIGVGSGFIRDSGQSSYGKSESLSLPAPDDDRFDEVRFIASLKADVEKKIIDSAAVVTHQGNVEGNFNTSEFYFEYSQGTIRGRVVISGKVIGSTYCLRADLEEISEGQGFNFSPDEFTRIRPEGEYYVVPLMEDDPLAVDNRLHFIGLELIKESTQRFPRGITKDQIGDIQYAELWSISKPPSHVKRLLEERGLERAFDLPGEYEGYQRVCFLNEVALRMYRDSGIALDVLRKVSSAEMPTNCSRSLRGPYFPKEELQ